MVSSSSLSRPSVVFYLHRGGSNPGSSRSPVFSGHVRLPGLEYSRRVRPWSWWGGRKSGVVTGTQPPNPPSDVNQVFIESD